VSLPLSVFTVTFGEEYAFLFHLVMTSEYGGGDEDDDEEDADT